MTKGQAPLFVLGGILAMMVWKMPSEDVSKLVFRLVEALERGYYVGYAMSIFSIAGWFLHAKFQRKTITMEMRRLAAKRDKAQIEQGIQDIESSK